MDINGLLPKTAIIQLTKDELETILNKVKNTNTNNIYVSVYDKIKLELGIDKFMNFEDVLRNIKKWKEFYESKGPIQY